MAKVQHITTTASRVRQTANAPKWEPLNKALDELIQVLKQAHYNRNTC